MHAAQPHRLTVELEGGGGPIAGRLTHAGEVREFRGWLELMAVVDACRASVAVVGSAVERPEEEQG